MANLNLKFLRGLQASLPTTGTDGYFYLTTDTHRLYTSIDGKVVPVNEGVTTVANLDALTAVTGAKAGDFFYCTEENILTVFNGQNFVQINPDTGATSVEVVGEGNAVTAASYDAATRKLTLTKGETFALPADISNAVGELGDYANVKAYVDAKTAGIASDEALGALTERVTIAEGEIDALQADSHTHTFVDSDVEDAIAKKHAHTFADADVVDAISKKHSHNFADETALSGITTEKVAAWDAVVADHLDSEDETALKNLIKEAKQAGTDADTYIKAYEVTNNARVKAVEDDIAEIVDGTDGILAQAKSYVDGKDSAMNTRVLALETAAPTHALKTEVEAVDAKFDNYNTTVAQKAIDDVQDAEIAKKVNKTDYEADKATFATKTDIEKLAGVSTGATKVEKSDVNGNIKIDGVETVVYTHPDKHSISDVTGLQDALDGKLNAADKYDDTALAGRVTAAEGKISALEGASATHATKDEAKGYADAKDEAIAAALKAGTDAQADVDALEAYVGTFTASEGVDTVVKYIDAKTANIASDERVNGIDNRVKAIEDDYLVEEDKTELAGLVTAEKSRAEGIEGGLRTDVDNIKADYLKASDKTELSNAIAAEQERAEGIEGGLRTDVDAIKADYLKAADKTALQDQITANANAITALTDGIDPDKIDGLTDLVNWANTHAPEVEGIKNDIEANAKAIADQATADEAKYETKTDAAQKLTDAKAYADAEVAKDRERIGALESVKDDYKTADATLKSELQAEIDADVKVVSDALDVAKTELNAAIEAAKTEASNQDAVVLAEAQKGIDALAQTVADNATAAGDAVSALEAKVYTKSEVEALISQSTQWGEF